MTAHFRGLAAGASLLGALVLGGGARASVPAPHITFRCGAIPPSEMRPVVTCRLAGQGFAPREMLAITYRVENKWMQGARRQNHSRITAYRRRARTDGRGSFARPPFSFVVPTGADVQVWKIAVRVQVTGERNDHAEAEIIGMAD
jgi:hypothetical protein